MMTILFIALSAGVMTFALYPLFSRRFTPFGAKSRAELEREQLTTQKAKLYADIKDLDFEFGIGKMAADDHQRLRRENLDAVARVMERLDQLSQPGGNGKITDEELESMIRHYRTTVGRLVCPACRTENPASAKFCSECGAKLAALEP